MANKKSSGPVFGHHSWSQPDGYQSISAEDMKIAEAETAEVKVMRVEESSEPSTGTKKPMPFDSLPRRGWGQRAILLLNVVTIFVSLLSAVILSYGHIRTSSINRVALDNQLAVPLGAPGNRVLNILLVGSDSATNLDVDDPVRINRNGERLGDVVIIAHLDERSGEVALLSLPRDLWLPIGGSTASGRVNTTFALGGPAKLIRTIEENFAIPIHHYVNVDFAGFKGLVEAVGSVEVYFDTPARDWNVAASPPRSQTGFKVSRRGCVALKPDQALAYVRSRYYQTMDEDGDWVSDPSSDLGRIERQQEFLGRLIARAIEMGARNPVVLRDLVDVGLDNVTIDQELTPQTLLDLGRTFNGFEPSELQTYRLPVEESRTSGGDVLLPIESQIDPVLRLFAGNRFDEPSTIAVRVEADTLENELIGGLLENDLDDSGFDLASNLRDDLPSGSARDSDTVRPANVVVAHGRSGRASAELVLANLGEEVASVATIVEDKQLAARRINVSLMVAEGQSDARAESSETMAMPKTSEGATAEGDLDEVGKRAELACQS